MNLLKDIKKLIKNNKEHNLKIEVDNWGVKVFLDYDPEDNGKEEMIIPIEYSTLEEFAYIPDKDYRKMYNVSDCGLDLADIELIRNIMHYLQSHSLEINELCEGFSYKYRNGDD